MEIKDYTVMIDGRNFFDEPVINAIRAYDKIWKIAAGQRDDSTTGCLLGYNYFKRYYKMIVIDLSKQQILDADPNAIPQINFTGSVDWAATIFLINKNSREIIFHKEVWQYCKFIFLQYSINIKWFDITV